jgi:UDP-N-acetylglucosamine 2-epimerase
MIDIVSIVGTRPEILRVIKDLPNHLIVDTGQHYDDNMDKAFWDEQGIKPDVNICAKSFSEIYDGIFTLLKEIKPKVVIIYGDTRSSFASALAAKDNDIKVAHLEAGVYGYDMNVPEERNRIMIDHISDYLFAINKRCKENLIKENVQGEIFVVGDMLFDRYLQKRKNSGYVLMTIHRKENQNIEFIDKIVNEYKNEEIVFVAHPVIKKFLNTPAPDKFKLIESVGHKEMLELIRNAKLVVSDSGGVIRESFFMGVPIRTMMKVYPMEEEINCFGNGRSEEKIKAILLEKIC